MKDKKRKNPRITATVRGVVALAEWSDSRLDADVVILTDDDDEYYVDATDTAIRPAKFVNSRVEATGRVYEREDHYLIEVRRMRELNSFDDYQDPLEDEIDEDGFDDDLGAGGWSDDDPYDDYARILRGF